MSRTILHVDLNNFYASVECLYHPELRGKPVAVAGDVSERRGIILAKNMIAKAEARIYVSATGSLIEALKEPLTEAAKRGLKIVVITGKPFNLPGAIIYYAEKPNSQIRLIADSGRVLTGDLSDGDSSTCLYSGKPNLVDLFKDALKNEIKLIELTNK